MLRNLLTILSIFICFNLYSQNVYKYQSWTRVQLEYKKEKSIISQQLEHRYDFTSKNELLQARFQVLKQANNEVNTGAGLTITTNNEFRLHGIIEYKIHAIRIERRVFNNFAINRLRYMIYPEIKLNKTDRINIGAEILLQDPINNKPMNETRLMLAYSQHNTSTTISVGYTASIFQKYIINIFRVTAILHYGNN